MDSLSLLTSLTGECGSFVSGSYTHARKDFLGAGLHLSLLNRVNGVWLRRLQQSHYRNRCKFSVYAIIKKAQKHNYPWPDNIDLNQKGGYLKYLSHFKPLAEKPKPVTLDFEKPLVELEKKLTDVRKMAGETGLDFSDQISLLERKYQEAVTDLYTHLTPFQRLNIARHPNRPTFLDHVLNITDKWVELHGDRAGYDDPAIVTGLGSMDGKTYMFIGHQKGRNTKENIFRNFGMPTPHGYRKALRLMRYADHHKFPIITFIDTPGAFADLKSEEIGQGEAIAFNLRAMFGLEVPIVSVVIGEGGSGGALAIGCANKMLMLENAVFYVASPEACAAILWKTSKAAPKAAEKLKITASELCKLEVADGIIPEPLGGAHTDPTWTSQQIKLAVTKAMEELNQMDTDTLLNHRNMKFRKLGGFEERLSVDPKIKRNMKKSDASSASAIAASLKSDIEKLRSAIAAAGSANPDSPSPAGADIIEALKRETNKDIARAVTAMGLKPKLESLRAELSKEPSSPALKDRANRLVQEFKDNLSTSAAFDGLKQKLRALSEMSTIQEAEMVKKQVNEKLHDLPKEKMEPVIKARELLQRGEELDEETLAGVRKADDELTQVLESAGLEVLGVVPRTVEKANEMIFAEIEAAVDAAGLRAKLAELKSETGRASGRDDDMVKRLTAEIKEGILSSLDVNQLLEKVRTAVSPPAAPPADPPAATGADQS